MTVWIVNAGEDYEPGSVVAVLPGELPEAEIRGRIARLINVQHLAEWASAERWEVGGERVGAIVQAYRDAISPTPGTGSGWMADGDLPEEGRTYSRGGDGKD